MPNLNKKIDKIISEVEKGNLSLSKKDMAMLDDMVKSVKSKKIASEKRAEYLGKLDRIAEVVESKDTSVDLSPILDAIKALEVKPQVNVTVPEIKIPQIKAPIVNIPKTEFPKEIEVKKPTWYSIFNPKTIIDKIEELKNSIVIPKVILPSDPKNPVSVRLSDGEKFYRALGGIAASAASVLPFKNSKNEQQAALVNDDGRVQVDVITQPNININLDSLAKESKQLPNNHNVTVSNIASTPVITGFATSTNQTNGNQKAQIKQEVVADANNSSTTNLVVGNSYTFTGTATSTLGVVGLQVSLFTNKNARVFVEQSPDGTNWDLCDEYVYNASSNFGVTVQAISSYVRVRVVTNSETTTVFRLQTALCPIVEAVPRTLDQQGNFKVAAPIDDTGFRQMISPYNEAVVSGRIRTVGAAFDTSLDANYWLSSVSTGTVGVTGSEGIVTSGTADTHYARLYSTRRSRFVSGQSNKCRMNVRLQDTGTANVKRRWGIAWGATMPTITDGAYFQLDGTTFSVVTLKGSSETVISNGSFNGHLGSTFTPTFTNNNVCEILYTTGSVYFFIGDKLLHKVTASAASWTNTMSFHVWHDVVNSGNSAAVAMYIRSSSIYRIGQLITQPTSYYHASGQTAGVNLKVGPGNLHGIIFGSAANNSVLTLVDNTTGATPVLWQYNATGALSVPLSIDFKDLPFSTGLRLIVATGNASATIVYE